MVIIAELANDTAVRDLPVILERFIDNGKE